MEEVEMDFHGMKRKKLQALCKKHGILANKSNAEMAHLLTSILKGIENPKTQGQGELQNESDSMEVPKILKNVKFRPDVEIREYEPSVYNGRKRSMVNSGKVSGSPPRSRNRAQRTVERNVDEVVGKKRGRGGEKKGSVGVENVDVSDNSRPPVITKEGDVQLVKGSSRRRLRSREVVVEENVEGGEGDLVVSKKSSKRGEYRKRGNSEGICLSDEVSEENVSAKDDAKPANVRLGSRKNAAKNESASSLSVDFGKTESFGRTTRSRAKSGENTSSVIANKAETVEVQDEYEKVLQAEEILKGVGRYALGRKSFVPPEGLVVEILSEEGVEPGKGDRLSRRNARKKEGASLLSGYFGKTEIVGRTTRSRSKSEENTSSMTANKAETIEIQDESQEVLHLEEPLMDFGRYALRRKSIVPQKEVAVETVSEEGLHSVKDARRSKRNMVKATDSKPIVQVVTRRRTRFGAQAAVESADEITEVNKEHNKAVQLEESLNAQGRNASRQKSLTAQKGQVESEGPDEKIETRKQSRNSDWKFVNKVEASGQSSGKIEKAPIPIGQLRGSRHNTVVLSPTFATDELGIGEAAGMAGCLKRKRNPTLEKDSSTVGECLANIPSRELAQHASRSNLVGSTVPGKIVEKKQRSSAVPTMVEEAIFTEETQIEDTGLIMPEATGDKANFILNCSKEVLKTSDKKGSESKTSELRRTNFSEVAVVGSDLQEVVDTKTNLQETPSPTSTSLMLSASANQETPENSSQPIVLNEEVNTVAGDMEKLADVILDVGVDDPSIRSTEGGADFGNDNLNEHGLTELHTNASDTFPLANRFSSAKQSDFSGLEKGLKNKELGEDKHLESGDVNDCLTEVVDRTSALEGGFCDLENTGKKSRTNKNEHEEASCDDRPSPAAGEKMVNFSTETNLQEDSDVLLTQLTQSAEENQNFISEENSSNVFLVSRGTCTHELLDGEETCLSAPEKGTDEGENGSAAIVPLQFTGIGKQRLSFSAGDSSDGRKIRHHDDKSTTKSNSSCKDEMHVLEEKEAAADALPQSLLRDKKEDTSAITTDICIVETTGETEVITHSDSGKASTGVNSSPMLFEKLSGNKEMNAKRNCSIDATIDVPVSKFHEAVMDMDSGRNMDGESDAEQCEIKEEESGCAVETEHGDDNGCQKVSAEVNASGLTQLISKEREGFEGKRFDMMMGHSSDFHISNKQLVSGKNTAQYQCDHVVRKETVTGALLFELCDHNSSDEVAGNADASLTPTIYEELEIFQGKKVGSGGNRSNSTEGINMWTDQETISAGSDSNADTFTQGMDDRLDEEKTAEVSDGDLCEYISKDGEAADKESLIMTTEKLNMLDPQNEGNAQPNCPVGLGNLFSDYGGEFLKINDTGRNASPDIASADREDIDETSNGVMGTELELGVEAGKFDDLKEVNALELERSASVALENRISMDVIAASIKENVEKVEDDSKLNQSNIDDEKEYGIVALPQVTPKGITEHSVEEELHASNDDGNVASNDTSKNSKADRAGSVAVIGKICFEKTEGCIKWTERTPISPQIPESNGKRAKQPSLEQKLFAESSSGICGRGSSTDAVSELNVLLSHVAGEKYKSHPGSKSIGNEAGGKAVASNDRVTEQVPPELPTGSDASALFTNWEVNLIQGNGEQDQVEESDGGASEDNLIRNDYEHNALMNKNVEEVLFTNREVNLILGNGEQDQVEEPDGVASEDNLISNDSEHTAWMNKNVEEVLFTNREVNLILGNGEQDQVEESDGVASEDKISNGPLDEHAAKTSISNNTLDDAPRDLKVDIISYSDIQDTCVIGSGAIDKVSSGAAAKMDILEEVGTEGISQPVILAEASHEMAESPLQQRFLCCSKSEESMSPDTSCGLPEITSGGSVVQQNGPVSYEGEFLPQLYCKDMNSHGGEETTCDYRGRNSTEQGEFHQEDYEVLIAQNVGAEEVREALATDDTSPETNPSDPREVAIEQAIEHPDALNESLLVAGLDCQTQNQQSCQKERESHSIETEATNCLDKLDDGVFSEEIVDFGNGIVTSPFKRQRDVDSPAGPSISASQHHITENDAGELNLFFGENEQDENQMSDAWFLYTNLRNEGARKVEENIVVTEQPAIQVAEEQHGEQWQVMDEQIEEEKHTYIFVSDEPNFEDVEGSKKQDYVPLEIDSIQECINCENLQNKSVNTEHSYVSKEKELLIDVNEVNACHDAVSSEQMGEYDSSYLKQYNNEKLSVEDIGVTENLSVDASSKPMDESSKIINSTSVQDIAIRGDQTHQLKLPSSSQKTVSCYREEETHSSDAKQLTTSLVRRKTSKTGFVQATPQKMVTYTDMKENLASIKREQRGNMTASNPLSKRRALKNLRNN